MTKLTNLEKSLRQLPVKPRLSFRIRLAFKIYLRLWQKRHAGSWKIGLSMAVLALFVSSIFGAIHYFNYKNSYAYYLDLAEQNVDELSDLISKKPN